MKYAHSVSKKFVELYAQFFLKIYRVPIGCFVIKSVSRKLGSNKLRDNDYYIAATSRSPRYKLPGRVNTTHATLANLLARATATLLVCMRVASFVIQLPN